MYARALCTERARATMDLIERQSAVTPDAIYEERKVNAGELLELEDDLREFGAFMSLVASALPFLGVAERWRQNQPSRRVLETAAQKELVRHPLYQMFMQSNWNRRFLDAMLGAFEYIAKAFERGDFKYAHMLRMAFTKRWKCYPAEDWNGLMRNCVVHSPVPTDVRERVLYEKVRDFCYIVLSYSSRHQLLLADEATTGVSSVRILGVVIPTWLRAKFNPDWSMEVLVQPGNRKCKGVIVPTRGPQAFFDVQLTPAKRFRADFGEVMAANNDWVKDEMLRAEGAGDNPFSRAYRSELYAPDVLNHINDFAVDTTELRKARAEADEGQEALRRASRRRPHPPLEPLRGDFDERKENAADNDS